MTRTEIDRLVSEEMERAKELHKSAWLGRETHSDHYRLPILLEEVAEAYEGFDPAELIQVLQCCRAWRLARLLPDMEEPNPDACTYEMIYGLGVISRAVQEGNRMMLGEGLQWVEAAVVVYLEAL